MKASIAVQNLNNPAGVLYLAQFMHGSPQESSAIDKEERGNNWLTMQPKFINEHWLPLCGSHGLDQSQAIHFWLYYFKTLGNAFRGTCIDEELFMQSLEGVCNDLLSHLDRHKYFLSEWNGDVSWEVVLKHIRQHPDQPVFEIDAEQDVAFFSVQFPSVEGGAVPRLRYVFNNDRLVKMDANAFDIAAASNAFHEEMYYLMR